MKKTKVLLVVTLIVFGMSIWYIKFQSKDTHEQNKFEKGFVVSEQQKIEIIRDNTSNSHKMELDTQKIEMYNRDYFNEIYSLIVSQDSPNDSIIPGKEIEVENFFDLENEYSYFIPLFSNNRVVAVAIFRDYEHGNKKLARVGEIRENWFSYPPVMLSDATKMLQNQYPSVVARHISGYYYIEDGETPYYLFEGDDNNTRKFYLVSTYDKHIVVKNRRNIVTIPEEPVPGRINSQGYLEINKTLISKLSHEEQIQLRREVDMTNQYIRDGIMKFDQDMNIIFDKRTEEDFERERSLYEQGIDEVIPSDNDEVLFTIDSNDVKNISLE